MASYAYTFTSGDTVTPTKLNNARTVSEIVNADVSATAALAHTKLASITAGQVLLGNGSNVPTATALSGDVTVNSSGVTAISSGVIVDADVNAAAAISLSKLATGALPTAITVASANLVDGTIVNADINAAAAIDLSKLATGALPSAITVASANLVDGTIVNADINASAAIADTKLSTISTAGKVSNSATTATNANTANAIVTRDASGNFSAGTITASLSGNVTGNLTGTASAIADGSVTTAKIVDDNVTNAKLATGIDASKITTGTLPIARIADAAVTQAKLAGGVATTGPAFRAYATASTTGLVTSVAKKIELAGETFDTANCFASSRFTANVAGYYLISAGVRFEALTNASAMLGKNGAIHSVGSTPNAGNYHSVVSDLIYLNGTTDYIELFGIQYSGTTQNTGIADSPGTFMSGFLARAA